MPRFSLYRMPVPPSLPCSASYSAWARDIGGGEAIRIAPLETKLTRLRAASAVQPRPLHKYAASQPTRIAEPTTLPMTLRKRGGSEGGFVLIMRVRTPSASLSRTLRWSINGAGCQHSTGSVEAAQRAPYHRPLRAQVDSLPGSLPSRRVCRRAAVWTRSGASTAAVAHSFHR